MKYVISNISLLPNEKEKGLLIDQIERLVKKLKIIPEHYIGAEKLKINISRINHHEYRVSCSLMFKSRLVFVTESGKEFKSLTYVLFDKFRRKVANQIAKSRQYDVKNLKLQEDENLESYKEELHEFKQSKDETSFKSLVKILLPGLERYVIRMLQSARMADLLKAGDIKAEDIIDEIIVRTFNTFETNQDDSADMNIWMMKETDIVLNELIDSVKHSSHATSIEELLSTEMAGMEEKYMLDSSGDPIMMDELEEFDYPGPILGIEEEYIVSGSEMETIDQISDKLSRKQMKDLIQNEMVYLPLRHQSVYDLFYFEQNTIEDLALIKGETEERIEEILEEVKDFLRKRLSI